ncbi:hypothetical protein [Demequina gelatinilytica]|uniref:hypothetical protein n=1 Tax=Demequina gelatinilytica TaxID=1638980 RepID=UPI0012E002E8|nr:hypothetical protein [Demequina gelatinilytica]
MGSSPTGPTQGKRALLEGRLGELARTTEAEARYRDLRVKQVKEERLANQRRWEDAMERARTAYREDYERRHFLALADRWAEATKLRAFITAMTARSEDAGAEWTAEVDATIARAATLADSLDPTTRPAAVMCEVPEPKPDDLKPFLGGLSAYGASSRW